MQKIHLLVILLLALSSNLDNIGVGISYGVRKIRIPLASNLLIAFITGGGTLLSMLVGHRIYDYLKPELSGYLGSFIIIGVGIWIFFKESAQLHRERRAGQEQKHLEKADLTNKSFFEKIHVILENPFAADIDWSGHISLKEGVFLGIALTLNNLANGVGAGMMGLSPTLTTFFVVIFSLLTIWVSIQIGRSYGYRWLGSYSGISAGVLLILIGVIMIFT